MGLDQWAFARPPGRVHEDQEIMYWRKHSALHGWMTDLAIDRKIVKDPSDFNVVEIQLTAEDIERLEHERFNMRRKFGFFFGNTEESYQRFEKQDYDFIKQAKDYLDQGYVIIYTSWW